MQKNGHLEIWKFKDFLLLCYEKSKGYQTLFNPFYMINIKINDIENKWKN